MAGAVNRIQNLRSLRIANADGAFATAFATLVTGSFLVGFIKLLQPGAESDRWLGILAALPSLLGILQIPGAIWGRRFHSYKTYVGIGGGIWRLLYVPFAILPVLAISGAVKLSILVACVGVASASVLLVQPIYNEWLAEMIPDNSRGWFFGRRNAIATGVGAVVGILGGLALDYFRRQNQETLGLTVIFGTGIFFAACSMVCFLSMRDLKRAKPVAEDLRKSLIAIKKPFADREFRKVLVFLAMFFTGQAFAGNFFTAYALESLKLSFTLLQFLGMMQAAGIVLSSAFWGFVADKYGNKPTLIIGGLGIATNLVPWVLTIPGNDVHNIAILIPGHLLMGFFWGAVNVSQFNLLLATSKPEDRANYIGAGLALQSVFAGISPILGAAAMTTLRVQFDPLIAYKSVFTITMLLRVVAILFLAPVREEGSAKVGRTLRDLRGVTPKGFRTMRSLARSADTAERAEALGRVADQKLTLASDEVVRSLADPSPEVRRQAAHTLARLGDPQAVVHLLEHIEQHPDLVEEETIQALGTLGSKEAVSTLISFLQSPRSLLRRAAARALGRLGSQDAVEALMQSANESDDPDLQRSSIQALRLLGAREAAQVISDALFNPHPSVRIAAAEAVAEMELRNALPYLRQSLSYYQDEAASEVAYALSAVGGPDQIPQVLEMAKASKTTLARQRCLLGVARLLGVEAAAYKLFLKSGMARDTALMDLLQPLTRRSRKVKAALERYASGDETEAASLLGQASNDPIVRELAESPIRDMFLVLAPYVAQSFSPTSKQSSARHR
ncbi:MAG TPA: MFS transporter [Fimbriimonadaceae bacterium]|nr:MFS transporter [Fimbriimonadaceae bacterium]